jgi:hypothetical protein
VLWPVAEALKVLRTMTVDLTLLDVALGGETVFPLSRMLERLGVPFIFSSPAIRPCCPQNIARGRWCPSRGSGRRSRR